MTLRDEIHGAFASNVYPGDDRLTVYDVAGRAYDETFQLLRGKTWQEMPIAQFLRGDTPIPDLTAESFHYYLPALLIASLEDISERDFGLVETLVFYLSPASASSKAEFPYDDTDRYERKLSLLTDRQRDTVIKVLEEYVARKSAAPYEVSETIARLREKGYGESAESK